MRPVAGSAEKSHVAGSLSAGSETRVSRYRDGVVIGIVEGLDLGIVAGESLAARLSFAECGSGNAGIRRDEDLDALRLLAFLQIQTHRRRLLDQLHPLRLLGGPADAGIGTLLCLHDCLPGTLPLPCTPREGR